jgi:Protein of unknown function (DUF1571)
MDDRKRHVGRGVSLGLAVALAGCVTMGRPLPETASRPSTDRIRLLVKGDEVPLVPVPPPPYGRPDEPTPASLGKPLPETPVSAKASATPAPKAVPAKPVSAAAAKAGPEAPAAVTARQLVSDAQKKYAGIDSYIVRLTRREVVGNKPRLEEVMLFKFRKQPWSVYFKWLSKEGLGREVVLVRGRHEGKLHTLLAAGDIPFMPAGRRMALAPDNILVRSATRHPVTEAGIGACLDRLSIILTAMERGERKQGGLQLIGPIERAEFDRPVYGLEHALPAGLDPSLPRGGRRLYFFHPENQLPTLIIARDERGQEVEYYFHDRLLSNVKLDDDDFDPDRLWNKAPAKPAGR